MECFGIRRKRKKNILSWFAARIGDLLLHPGPVIVKKGNPVAIPVQERIVNLVRNGLVILRFRIVETIQGGIQPDKVRVGSCAPRVEAEIFQACRHSFFVLPQIGVVDS